MPANTGKAVGFSLKGATLQHRDNEVVEPQDFTQLPGGITGAIAKLKGLSFGVYKTGPNQGKQFFRAFGVVQSPRTTVKTTKTWQDDPPGKRTLKGGQEVIVGTPVEVVIQGRTTSIMRALCETSYTDDQGKKVVTSAADHLAEMVNDLKLLSEETFNEHIGALDENSSEADARKAYEELFVSLVEQGIRFKFSTSDSKCSKKYPTPRVFENWLGTNGVEEEAAADPAAGVEDGGADTATEGAGDDPPADDDVPAADEVGDLPDDLDELAVIAADDDHPQSAEAMDKLILIAEEAGIDTADGTDFHKASEEDAVTMIREAQNPTGDATQEPEPWTPAKGETCLAKVWDAKGKKYPKASQVEVVSVNAKAETCTVKSGVTGKPILDPKTRKPAVFKFAELSQEE